MIRLHRLNGQEVVVNADLIESIESHVDTVIGMVTGNRIVVTESTTDVIERVVEYRKAASPAAVPEFLKGVNVHPCSR